MSIDFAEYVAEHDRTVMERAVEKRDREIVLRLLQTRFGERFTADHRARVEAADATRLTQIIDNFAKPGFTLDDALATLGNHGDTVSER